MNRLIVKLWGEEIGQLVWNPARKQTYFTFNPKLQVRQDITPLAFPLHWKNTNLPIFGDDRRIYQGLPPFIADSLPDSWGNKLFDQWIRINRINRNKISPLFKLMFIGRRGMGAFEFEPAANELEHSHLINIQNLYRLSTQILNQRESIVINADNNLTMQALLSVGTSAGGRQMKAVVAINNKSGEIRSGQIEVPPEFEYYIIKFQDERIPTTEIEMAYFEMASASGIIMEKCREFRVEGVSHFLTKRFDRKNGMKLHMQTLAAINPDAESYEDLMETCRKLGLSENELSQVFRRIVFNILANNTDDHNKNFSFILEKDGKWEISPAYDLTFIFNRFGSGPDTYHIFSLFGKTNGFTKQDLLDFASEQGIRNGEKIISEVADTLSSFPDIAVKYNIPDPWKQIIQLTLRNNLADFGYIKLPDKKKHFIAPNGKLIELKSLSRNTKNRYHISALVDGKPRKAIVPPNTDAYLKLQQYELGNLEEDELTSLIATIFPENN